MYRVRFDIMVLVIQAMKQNKKTKSAIKRKLRNVLDRDNGVYASGRIQDKHVSEHTLQWDGKLDLEEQKAHIELRPMTDQSGATIDLAAFSKVARKLDAPQVAPPNFGQGYELGDKDLQTLHDGANHGVRRDVFKEAASHKRIQPGPDYSYVGEVSTFWNSLPDHAQEALIAQAELQSRLSTQNDDDTTTVSFVQYDNVKKKVLDDKSGYRLTFAPKSDQSEVGPLHIHVDEEKSQVTVQ